MLENSTDTIIVIKEEKSIYLYKQGGISQSF